MFNARLWKITRHLFDEKNTTQSLTLGIGAGAGLFVAGVAVWPALAAASVVTAGAGVLRSYWDDFKRNTFPSTQEQLDQAWNDTPHPTTNVSSLNKASQYNNFLETVETALEYREKHSCSDVVWLQMLSDRIDWAIDVSRRRGEGFETLQSVKEQTRIIAGPIAGKAAIEFFSTAMDRRIKNDIPNLIGTVNDLYDALELNGIAKSMVAAGDAQKELIYVGREQHLKAKVNMLKATIEKGIFIGDAEPSSIEGGVSYIMNKMSRIEAKFSPTAPPLLRENPATNNGNEKMPYAQLEMAWDKTFLREPERSSPASVLNAYSVFDTTLSDYAEQHGPSINTMDLASLMHQRLSYTLDKESPDEKTVSGIRNLLSKTAQYLEKDAAALAVVMVNKVDEFAPLNSYSDVSFAAGKTREAALAQAIAAKFAPNSEIDETNAKRLEQRFSLIQASVTMGLTNDEKFFPNLKQDTPQESVNISIAQTNYQMDEMRKALQQPEQTSALAMS